MACRSSVSLALWASLVGCGGYRAGPLDGSFPFDGGSHSRDVGFPALDRGFPVDRGRPDTGLPIILAGQRCAGSEECGDGLECVLTLQSGGFCTQICDVGGVADERTQCGGVGSTCLSGAPINTMAMSGVCTRTCIPGSSSSGAGTCRDGQVCMGFWYNQTGGEADSAECFPFVLTDSHCTGVVLGDASAPRCNVRTGRCAGAPSDASLRRDGDPCNPVEIRASGKSQCRGTCFSVSTAAPAEGVCGSFVNARLTSECPDDVMQAILGRTNDNIGLCVFRGCDVNSDCATGHVCRFPEQSGVVVMEQPTLCQYPSALQPTGISAGGRDR